MQSPNRNKAILISVVLLPVVIALVVFIFTSSRSSNSNAEEYLDPGSGETVSSPKNKTPEKFGISTDGPTYLGFSKLIDAGLTTGQLELVKVIFGRFSVSDSRNLNELSITVETIDLNVSDEGMSMSFELTANRTTQYQCVISYVGLDDARVVIADKDGKQVFDSSVQ